MANRFTTKKKRDFFLWKEVVLPVALFLAILLFLRSGINSLGSATAREQLSSAKQAVVNATVQCYALEGRYPPNVDYLREHYGLQVDPEKYIVHYSIFSHHIMPDIDVIPLMPIEGLTEEEAEVVLG